jgi:hypothetical protein
MNRENYSCARDPRHEEVLNDRSKLYGFLSSELGESESLVSRFGRFKKSTTHYIEG